MKYKRNSRFMEKPKKKTSKKPKTLKNPKQLPAQEDTLVAKQLKEDAKWVEQLNATEKFSSEWVHKVLLELLMQCMGKKEVLYGFKGAEKIARVFKPKEAIPIVQMIAKMNGHLFDIVKGNINQNVSGTIEHEHQHTIEMTPNEDRTAQVLEILEQCGAIKPGIKQLDHSEVVEIHTA